VQVGPHSTFVFGGAASFAPPSLEASLEPPSFLPPSVLAGGESFDVDGPSEPGTSSEPIVQL
jgi:hypothetical protein